MALNLLDLSVCGGSVTGLAVLNCGQVGYEAEGGLVAGGSAQVTVNPYVGSTSGGVVASGSADCKFEYGPDCDTCSAESSGESPFSIVYSPAVSGGIVSSDSASVTAEFVDDESGGSVSCSGEADGFPIYSPSTSGGAEASGAALVTIEIPYTASGGVDVSGSAVVRCDFIVNDAGGDTITNGEALVRFIIDTSGLPVFIRRYDGDIRLKISEDGGIITIWGGQPEMEQGLETAVNMSLFTEAGWWGNALAQPGDEIGSKFIDALSQPLTNQARLDIIEAAKTALSWLTSSGIALYVTVTATIPGVSDLALYIEIKEPEKAPHAFRYNINWQAQKIKMTEAAA